MNPSKWQSGFSLLEVMVVLALLAGLSTVALLSLPSAEPTAGTIDLVRLIADRRNAAILSGRAVTIEVTEGTARSGQLGGKWQGLLLSGGQPVPMPLAIVAHADGTYSGPPLAVRSEGKDRAVPGTFRSAP